MSPRGPLLLLLLLTTLTGCLGARTGAGPTVHCPDPPERGVPPPWLEVLDLDPSPALRSQQARSLAVRVAEAGRDLPAMLGRVEWVGDALRFTPRYPFRPGLAYRVTLGPPEAPDFEQVVRMPDPPPAPPTRVVGVFPSGDTLPENVLRFYLHFSAPMSQGRSYQHVEVREEDGTPVDLPFLELGEELWNQDGTRLTLLIDPGRIKHGLRPREELGPVFQEGRRYTLTVAADWPDAAGRPLAEGFQRDYAIRAPDTVQPDPYRWAVQAPRAGTREPLAIDLDEPLDHAMLHRVLAVKGPGGDPARQGLVAGTILVSREERRWTFRPDQPWRAGTYFLEIATDLEDQAGNSLARPFEVDLVEPVTERVETSVHRLPLFIDPVR